MNTIEELQKVVDDLRSIAACDYYDMVQDWASRLQSIIDRMRSESAEKLAQEPVAWMNPLNGVVISSIVEDGSRINLVNMAEYGFDTPLYAAPPVPDGMVLVPEVLLRQISKWLAESADPYDKAAYAINGLIAAAAATASKPHGTADTAD